MSSGLAGTPRRDLQGLKGARFRQGLRLSQPEQAARQQEEPLEVVAAKWQTVFMGGATSEKASERILSTIRQARRHVRTGGSRQAAPCL